MHVYGVYYKINCLYGKLLFMKHKWSLARKLTDGGL